MLPETEAEGFACCADSERRRRARIRPSQRCTERYACESVEVLADEQKPTLIGFLRRAVAWFNGQGIACRRVMSDNGPAYVAKAFGKACRTLVFGTSAPGPTRPEPTAKPSAMASGRLRHHSDPLPRRGLRHRLLEFRRAEPLAAPLPGDLRPPQEPLGPRLALTTTSGRLRFASSTAVSRRVAPLTNVVRHTNRPSFSVDFSRSLPLA